MILAAGLGTRLKPFTNEHPKALALVNGKSLLQRNIEYLQSFGIEDVVVNTHHFAEQIEEAVTKNKGWGSKITLSFEKDVLETGGGLLFASTYFINEANFVLMNADVLTNLPLHEMIEQHRQKEPLATLAVSNRSTSRYLLFTDENELCGWRNINTGEVKIAKHSEHLIEKAFSGIHIINQTIFSLLQPLFSGKFSMIDVYLQLAKTEAIHGFAHDNYTFVDVGKPESIAVAEGLFH
ncbi:MAG: sugar phosphate nucleotidyltransferase [Bacteroidota bacterium]|nr:sugar phosphate nucleotidyltransferase [Bacteroidota bacterium]